ncbi:hypothetical protein GV828_08145 [Flavobacterium sp. NST-5]|uniref:Uncharacterized protein n=1 Tax=Flavobacterium ichthyis TaxID=2698827 RepID=A0ABW9Z8E7_9FLAO|nr:hypothetical protein [Flavobacterium ichthyis]NBL65166.1 hypothetical protein [Flavobacterium ichthyis]
MNTDKNKKEEWEGGNDTLAENNAKNEAYLKTEAFKEKAKEVRKKEAENDENDLNYNARNVSRTSVRDNIPNTITDRSVE